MRLSAERVRGVRNRIPRPGRPVGGVVFQLERAQVRMVLLDFPRDDEFVAAAERHRPLAAYRAAELAIMARNFSDPREP